ncbi:MAG: CoA-binding protein [Nanoarchaeota archaeon]
MAILIDEKTNFLIQGITGKQGQLACKEMMAAGSKVVCGVTPGKGGEEVDGIPVYNSVVEAKERHSVDASVIFVPPRFVKEAIVEAVNANVPLINVITENIPMHDMAYCFALAKKKGVKIIGATSAGIYSVGKAKCGPIASGKSRIAFSPGKIGVLSRSGGMSCETSLVLTQAALGQSTVVSIGSDVLMGESFLELVKEFEADKETEGIVLFGEIGGTSEEDLAAYLIKRRLVGNPFLKPIVAFISGKFAKGIQNVSLGHAGAIIEGNKGTRENKVKILKEAGVIVAEVHHQVGELMKKELENRK